MVDLAKDLHRLELFTISSIGLEFLSPITHLKDFMTYYFTRYVSNLTHTFKNFYSSEISDLNKRHGSKLALLFRHPTIQIDSTIVPIPTAMVGTYRETLESLVTYLELVHPDMLGSDLEAVITALDKGELKQLTLSSYTKPDFDDAKDHLSKLYGKNGLTHSTALRVICSKNEFSNVNQQLLTLSGNFYPMILRLSDLVNKVEVHYNTSTIADQDRVLMANHLMTLAYRLSILSTIMNHVQDMEHAFVKSLNIFIKKM